MAGKRPAVLGIDVGTSGVKLLLHFLPERGGAEAPPPRIVRTDLEVSRPSPAESEIDPAAWWRAVCRAAARLDTSDAAVLGIAASTLFPALVAMDDSGRALRPAILYDDRRSAVEVEEFARAPLTHPAFQHLLTGNVARPGTVSVSSLLWLRRHEPGVFARAHLFGHAGTFLGLCLTGRAAIDAPSASLTGLYATASGEAWLRGVCRARGLPPEKLPARPQDLTYADYLDLMAADSPAVRDRILADLPPGMNIDAFLKQKPVLPESGWVQSLLDAVGLQRERLPEVLWPGDRLGTLSPAAARSLGLAAGIQVAVGAGDSACGALGLGLAGEGEMVVTCRSTDCLTMLREVPAFSTRTMNMTYMDAGTWLEIAPMNSSGAAVDWFVDTFLGRARDRYERFFRLAGEAPAGAGGVVFLPYLAGERSPVYDPAAKGVFFGLTRETGLAAMARAVLEGVAFAHRQILRMADVRLGRPIDRVIAAGGCSIDPLWRRIRVDAADRAYSYADRAETSALGAALLGGVAAGVFGSWREAAAEARRGLQFEEIRPDPAVWHTLNRNFEIYASLYDALRHCF
ncbi:MAG: FGGY family carbohydrate kinase [Planctomycetota bacterium]|nr:FGGY family carbohydrate kinase [Planctomycetota bacterium]